MFAVNGGVGAGDSLLQRFIMSTRFTIPIARCATRLFTGHHRDQYLVGDSTEPRLDDGDNEYQSVGENCAYSKPFAVLDLIWNLAFVFVSVIALLSTFRERPSTPLRVWIFGYALQSILHVGFVYLDYESRNQDDNRSEDHLSSSQDQTSSLKRLESLNTMLSSIWWAFGFYWIVVGGRGLLQDSPRLYWLTVVFLAFDVFYIISCIGIACIIFTAIMCCVPLVAIAYAVRIREGATEDEINVLPKYRFRQDISLGQLDHDKRHKVVGERMEPGCSNSAYEVALLLEDSECSICLSQYIDGAELCTLPCNHHFHSVCISRWLRINAICPLCKFNILRRDTLV